MTATPNNLPEMLEMIASALSKDNIEALEHLRDVNNNWLQTDEERQAMNQLLDAVTEKIEQSQ
ncbi:MAG: hypothetical protein WD097_09200 [Balneolales bacterium]